MKYGPMFTDRESGVTIRVDSVNDTYAQIIVVRQLESRWGMPTSRYDTEFVKQYLPLDTGAGVQPGDKYRPPANADYWDQEQAELRQQTAAESRGETDSGVRIGETEQTELYHPV